MVSSSKSNTITNKRTGKQKLLPITPLLDAIFPHSIPSDDFKRRFQCKNVVKEATVPLKVLRPVDISPFCFELIRNYLGEVDNKLRVELKKQAIPISILVKRHIKKNPPANMVPFT